jgi:hypothetical protein
VIAPPHRWFDAALARQMVIHLMVKGFNIPKRRVVEMQGRSREAINRALTTLSDEELDALIERARAQADLPDTTAAAVIGEAVRIHRR